MAADGGSGEERGDLMAAPSSGECGTVLTSRSGSWGGSESAIFRFFVEAVLKLGGLPLEPMQLQGQAEGQRLGGNA